MYVSIAELIRQEGPLPPAEVVRWLAEICDALGRLAGEGVTSTVEAGHVSVSRDPTEVAVVEPRPFDAKALPVRWQVREVGALGYQMLKGQPPPAPLTDTAFDGLHPGLAQLLAALISGTGPVTTAELARALRGLRLATAPPKRNTDTVLKARKKQDTRDRSGELFGQFELVRLLGEGGMGEVYLARHVRLAREVAIKLLKPEMAEQPDLVHRFFQEANVVNEIRHPHIVQVQDFVEEPGRVYCVMELLEGLSLADLAEREGPLPLGRICFIVAQVCDALHAAHLREVVHRDIKPENVFITRAPDGGDFAKVLDFGIARRAASGTNTQAGAVMGTPQYMAPEQAAGRTVDARADLYAVGVMLFELISGKTVAEVGGARLPENDARGSAVPNDLRQLVESLLSLDPAGRPGSSDEVRVRLLPHVRTTSQGGLMPGAPYRPPQTTTQSAMAEAGLKRSWAPFAALGGAVLVLGGGLWLAVGPGASAARVEPEVPAKLPEPPKPVPVAVKPPEPVPPPEPPEPLDPPEPPEPVDAPPPEPPKPDRPRPGKKPKPAPVVAVAPPPLAAPAVDPAKLSRLAAVEKRYGALRANQANKINALEHQAVQDVLDARRVGPETVSDEALSRAEKALKAAETRNGL